MNQRHIVNAFRMLLVVSAGATLLSGCSGSGPDGTASDTNQSSQTVNTENAAPLPGDLRLELNRGADQLEFQLSGASGWSKLAPGVWQNTTGEQLLAGKAGHEWLTLQLEQQISKLKQDLALNPALSARIRELEAQRDAAAASALVAEAENAPLPQISCTVGFYTGPSSPLGFAPGAAALAQTRCSGGCVVVTITSVACCASTGCGPTVQQTATVCTGVTWTAGSLRFGAGAGYAAVVSSPPNVGQVNNAFTCQ